jgi:hypothetical protein
MNRILVPSLACFEQTTVSRVRSLPISGEIDVAINTFVNSRDTLIRANMLGDTVILKISEKMSLTPEEVIIGLKVKEGDSIIKNHLICEHKGFFGLLKSSFLSPVEGVVEFISATTGHVGVRKPSNPISINSYISGFVTDINNKSSVTVTTNGAFLQGIFGVGGERIGKIRIIDNSFDKLLTEELIPNDCKDEILVGGFAPTTESIKKAVAGGAVGLVTGSIEDKALQDLIGYELGVALTGDEEIKMSLIITEGFGKIPISKPIEKILTQNDTKEASINGSTQVRAGAVRPEIIIPNENALKLNEVINPTKLNIKKKSLSIDSTVRVVRYPYFGKFAQVLELIPESQVIATGAKTRVVRIKLEEDGREIIVPRANIELT